MGPRADDSRDVLLDDTGEIADDSRDVLLDDTGEVVRKRFYPPNLLGLNDAGRYKIEGPANLLGLNDAGRYKIEGPDGDVILSTAEDMWVSARAGQHVRVLYEDKSGKVVYFPGVLGRFDGVKQGWQAFFEDGETVTLFVPDADVMLVPEECSDVLPVQAKWWGHMYARLLRHGKVHPPRLNLSEMAKVAKSHYKGVTRGVRQKVSEGGGMRGTAHAPPRARSWGLGWESDSSGSEPEPDRAVGKKASSRSKARQSAAQRQLGGAASKGPLALQLEALFDGRSLTLNPET
ncbi:hypothetical protein T484DRAFT_1822550 [Baffinella frigidus]|nr:hypothetical protein T484DRAFT_1822550 [Cryptophyta sp. CCMP2293]